MFPVRRWNGSTFVDLGSTFVDLPPAPVTR